MRKIARSGADEADPLVSNSMNRNEEVPSAGYSNDHEALFLYRMIRVHPMVMDSGVVKRVLPSAKSMPCFRRFARSLSSDPTPNAIPIHPSVEGLDHFRLRPYGPQTGA